MALINDITPPRPKKPAGSVQQQITDQIRQVHRATQLSNLPKSRVVRRLGSFDIVPTGQLIRSPRAPRIPTPVSFKPPDRTKARTSRRHKISEFVQYPLITAIAIAGAYSSTVGQALVGLYLLVSLVTRLSSRFSFAAALLLLASVPGFQALHLTGVAQNAAIYAYELLVVGTVQAIIELVRDRGSSTYSA